MDNVVLNKSDILKLVKSDLLPVGQLEVLWQDAQQPFVLSHGRRIVDDFSWELLGEPIVMGPFKSGKYHICDGQHRIYAVREKYGLKETIPVRVYPPMDKGHAAWLFHEINSRRRRPAGMSLFKTAVIAGQEPEASIAKAVKSCGFSIGGNGIKGISALQYAFRLGGAKLIQEALVCLTGTWGPEETAHIDAATLKSFTTFLHDYPHADRKALCTKVGKQFTAARFLGAVRALSDAQKITTTAAGTDTLVRVYNLGRKTEKL
jgi:hypothetical protein